MMSKHVCKSFMVSVGILLSLGWGAVQAEGLVFTSPPRESKAVGEKLYGPVAAYMSQVLGVKVTYKHPGNFLTYARDMRNDAYDIVFDGPQFISWRQAHLKSEAVVKLQGTITLFLVVRANDKSISALDDLIGKRICSPPPPNLAALIALDKFRNPVRQPVMVGVKGGMKGVLKAYQSGRCDAAVFRDTFFMKKLKPEVRDSLRVLYRSKSMPNQGMTTSSRISAADRAKLQLALTSGKGLEVTAPLIQRFGGKLVKAFVPTSHAEYEGYNSLIEGVIFGW